MERRSREQMREEFKQRLRDENNRKDGGYYSVLFKKDVSIPFMKCGEGYHTVDILDYIAGENDPLPGKLAWVFEFYIYNKVGAGQGPILSLAKTFGLPDPIAEERAKKIRDGEDPKKLKALDPPAARALFNVICADSLEEEKKGVQVFHTSSYLFTDYVREMAKGTIRPGMEGIDAIIDFCDPKYGKSIKWKREGKEDTTKFILHQFIDRPANFEIPQTLLDKVFTLDELLHIPTYDELCEYYWGKGQHQPGAASLKQEESTASRYSQEKTSNPQEQVATEGRRGRYEQTTIADVKQDQTKEEDKKEEAKPNTCPAGHTYAVDIDKFPKDCEKCDEWKPCARAKRALTEKPVETKPAEEAKAPEQVQQPAASTAAPAEEGSRRRRRG